MKISRSKFEMRLAELGAKYGRGVTKRLAKQMKMNEMSITRYKRMVKAGKDFEPDVVGRIAKGIADLLHRRPLDIAELLLEQAPSDVGVHGAAVADQREVA